MAKFGYYAPMAPLGGASIAQAVEPMRKFKQMGKEADFYKRRLESETQNQINLDNSLALLKEDNEFKDKTGSAHRHISDGSNEGAKKWVELAERVAPGTTVYLKNSDDTDISRLLQKFGHGWDKYTAQVRAAVGSKEKAASREEAAKSVTPKTPPPAAEPTPAPGGAAGVAPKGGEAAAAAERLRRGEAEPSAGEE
jgi:hypothetical protein